MVLISQVKANGVHNEAREGNEERSYESKNSK
jgi:hypothetical protein